MPWSDKQKRLFRAVAHGWKRPGGEPLGRRKAKELLGHDKSRSHHKGGRRHS